MARRAGIAHPVGIAPRTDEIAMSVEVDWVDRQREGPAALPPTDFENPEMAADQADPNENNERATEDALDGTRSQIASTIPRNRSFTPYYSTVRWLTAQPQSQIESSFTICAICSEAAANSRIGCNA
jgi:hypothetical protein